MSGTSPLVAWMDRALYPTYTDRWDDLFLRQQILRVLEPSHCVLDLGAGAGIVPEMNFKGKAARVFGVDPDARVMGNPYLDEGRIGTGEDLPFADQTFDIVFADNVLEHLRDPRRIFKEVARVLRPGGRFFAKTPNRWHYVATLARLTPHAFHAWFNTRRGRKSVDTFPTLYLANTPHQIRALGSSVGLETESITLVEGRPEYLRTFAPAYAAG